MNSRKDNQHGRQSENRLDATAVDDAGDVHIPRRMTFAENAMLTVKVLAGFGLLGAALWVINLWKSAQ